MLKVLRRSLMGLPVVCIVLAGYETEETTKEAPVGSMATESIAAPRPTIQAASQIGRDPLDMPADLVVANPERNARRKAYFGDLHVHTACPWEDAAIKAVTLSA